VGFPLSDCVLETISEDEVYDLQFGGLFAQGALDPALGSVQRDDFALEIAFGEE
jgi:ferredoxin